LPGFSRPVNGGGCRLGPTGLGRWLGSTNPLGHGALWLSAWIRGPVVACVDPSALRSPAWIHNALLLLAWICAPRCRPLGSGRSANAGLDLRASLGRRPESMRSLWSRPGSTRPLDRRPGSTREPGSTRSLVAGLNLCAPFGQRPGATRPLHRRPGSTLLFDCWPGSAARLLVAWIYTPPPGRRRGSKRHPGRRRGSAQSTHPP